MNRFKIISASAPLVKIIEVYPHKKIPGIKYVSVCTQDTYFYTHMSEAYT